MGRKFISEYKCRPNIRVVEKSCHSVSDKFKDCESLRGPEDYQSEHKLHSHPPQDRPPFHLQKKVHLSAKSVDLYFLFLVSPRRFRIVFFITFSSTPFFKCLALKALLAKLKSLLLSSSTKVLPANKEQNYQAFITLTPFDSGNSFQAFSLS